jgi:glycerol-3-phosphate acyltransferase PlsY
VPHLTKGAAGLDESHRESWPLSRAVLAIAAAFALGCVPTAQLAVRFAGTGATDRLAEGNPGTSNIKRILGKKAAMAVFAGDALKGLLPAVIGRVTGADSWVIDSLMLAPVVGHVTVVGGKGVATLAGAMPAADPLAFAMICPIWVGATFKKDHARGVLVACSLYPVTRWLLGRGRVSVVLGAAAPLSLVYARLRGPGWGKRELNSRVLWERLVVDAELTSDSGGGGCE